MCNHMLVFQFVFQIRSFSSVAEKLKSIKGVTLNVANKVYIKEGDYDLNENMKEDAVKVFDAALEKIDFNKSVAAADAINKWVSLYILLLN